MKFHPERGDLRMISAFLMGLAVGMALMVLWLDARSRHPVYALHEPTPIRERQTND
jgi:hypothetical protein